jgi:hypothetical protein
MEGSSVSPRLRHETAGDGSSVTIIRRERMIETNASGGIKDQHAAKCTIRIVGTLSSRKVQGHSESQRTFGRDLRSL